MRIAIVGAGMAGLSAAHELQSHGHEPVVFELADHVGGRLETIQLGDYKFDSGANAITPRQSELTNLMLNKLDKTELVKIEKPLFFLEHGRPSHASSSANHDARYCYTSGIHRLPELMAEGLDVRLNTAIAAAEQLEMGFQLGGEQFDWLIVTAPGFSSEPLLKKLGERRGLSGVRYRSCLSVLLGYAEACPDVPYYSLMDPEQVSPIFWLSLESLKCPGRTPDDKCAIVVQMGHEYSEQYYDAQDDHIYNDATAFIRKLYGFAEPEVKQIRRWNQSQPELPLSFDSVNPRGTRLIVTGDAVLGGRAEMAFEAGLLAARRILES